MDINKDMYLVSETLSDLKNINAVMVITWFRPECMG
jgi:hypothetical protein